jgi:hypothetical protein
MRGVVAARRLWRRWRAIAAIVAIVAAFSAGTLNGGSRYLYCAAMHEVMTTCCCAPDPDREPGPAAIKWCCCVSRTVAGLPERMPPDPADTVLDGVPEIVAVTPLTLPFTPAHAFAVRHAPPRATGPPSGARELRARIQVYLI